MNWRWSRAVLIGGAGLVFVAVVLRWWGAQLPAEAEVQYRVSTRQGPSAVWDVVSALEKQADWNSELVSVRRVDDVAGLPAFQEATSAGELRTLVSAQVMSPHRIRRDVVEGGYLVGRWEIVLAPEERGTRIVFTQWSRMLSPYQRLVDAYGPQRVPYGARYLEQQTTHLGDPQSEITTVREDLNAAAPPESAPTVPAP